MAGGNRHGSGSSLAGVRSIAMSRQRLRLAPRISPLVVLIAAGCASIGPGSVPRDRLDYISAVAESWKEQTLLNIVRMRYGDAPSFVDVSSVISGYTFQGQLSANVAISSDLTATIPSRLTALGGNATYIDRPTITYTPLVGNQFAKRLLGPLSPSEVFELIQAGYPADAVLLITTRAVNGIYNRSGIGARAREADAEFYPLLDAMRRLQLSGAVSLRVVKRGSEEFGILILCAVSHGGSAIRPQDASSDTRSKWRGHHKLRVVTAQPQRDHLVDAVHS